MSGGLLLFNHGNLQWFYSLMLAGFRNRNLSPRCAGVGAGSIRRDLLWAQPSALDTAQSQQPHSSQARPRHCCKAELPQVAAADFTNSDFKGLVRHLELTVTQKSIKALSTHPFPQPHTWNRTGREMSWEMLQEILGAVRAPCQSKCKSTVRVHFDVQLVAICLWLPGKSKAAS